MCAEHITISELLRGQYEDFLSFSESLGKRYPSELNNVDFVAFRVSTGSSRERISSIKKMLEVPSQGNIISENKVYQSKAIISVAGVDSDHDLDMQDALISSETHDLNAVIENHLVNGKNIVNGEVHAEEDQDKPCVIQKDDNRQSLQRIESVSSSKNEEAYIDEVDFEHFSRTESLANIWGVDPTTLENISVDALCLSVRGSNALKRVNIQTISKLLSKSIEQLSELRNLGRKTLGEILAKTRRFALDPQNEDTLLPNQSDANEPRIQRSVDSTIITALKVKLSDGCYSDELNESQKEKVQQLIDCSEIVGKEICFEALQNPTYFGLLIESLNEFAAPFIQYTEGIREANAKIMELPESLRVLRAKPFFRAYCARRGDILSSLSFECNDSNTLLEIPLLFEKLKREWNFINIIKETNRFLDWLMFDVNLIAKGLLETVKGQASKKDHRKFAIFEQRTKGTTLESLGSLYGVTRERIRQIEARVLRVFWAYYDSLKYDIIMLIYALNDGKNPLFFANFEEKLGTDFATILWYCIKSREYQKDYTYSKKLDAIIIKTDDAKEIESSVFDVIQYIESSFPTIIEASQKPILLENLSTKTKVPQKLIAELFDGTYKHTASFYHKGRLTVVFMCDYILKNRFPGGFKTADEFEDNRFREYMIESFGDKAGAMTNRAIDAKVAEVGVLCDRGKYIHPDYLNIRQEIIDQINDYVENSSRIVIPYGEIYEGMKEVFEETQITNKYILQGALKKYGCRFYTGRDFVRKTKSVTFVDELEAFVADRGVVHKSEIFAEFTSLGEAGLGQAVARSANVFNIDNGYYIHADQFDIQPQDYEMLRDYLRDACKDIPVNIRSVHDAVSDKFPEFMYRNDFEDRNKLFAALNYMFRDEFNFSRPYIAKLGVSDISNRSVILQHIEDYDSIEIEELMDICDENNIHYVSSAYLFQLLASDYPRVNRTTMMRRELTGITEEVINRTNSIIRDLLEVNGYIVASKVNDFLWFPEIEVDWNVFLVENIVSQSQQIDVIYMFGDPLKRPNTIYVSNKYSKDTFDSFLIKILTEEVHKGSFASKIEMRDWLREEGMIEVKLPNFLESAKYFYVNETGVHCTGE